MKKPMYIIYFFIFLIINSIPVFASNNETRIFVNGKRVRFNLPLRIEQEIILAPVNPIAEKLRADVRWNANTATTTIIYGNTGVAIAVGNPNMTVRNMDTETINTIPLSATPRYINGVVYMPVGEIFNTLKLNVLWDRQSSILQINTPDYVLFPPPLPSEQVRNDLELSAYISFSERDEVVFTGSIGFYLSLFPYTFFGVEARLGNRADVVDRGEKNTNGTPKKSRENQKLYAGGAPVLGVLYPIENEIRILADITCEIGTLGIAPGAGIGIIVEHITFKYRGIFLNGQFCNVLMLGISIPWNNK
ncbi:MAG: copper amine oxidase N-terminal domain-containing protein [Treponema sp.]|nr:copper amine oxidase N-terminal domain-containing protein [Treponema sp.]